MNYRATILTSIYKSSEFLFHFLLDAKRQSIFSEIEFLLLDCNEDNDFEDYDIIKPFLDIPNFKYIRLGKCTVYEAWNKGIELASAPILGNWNTDDRRAYNSLDYQVSFLENNIEYDVCYGPTIINTYANEIFELCESNLMHPSYDATIENQLNHNSPHSHPIWRKSIHDRFGLFDTTFFSAADYDMWFRVLSEGVKMKNLPELIGLYYRNPNGISSNSKNFNKAIDECLIIRKKYQ
jgi:hypothetical protein